MVFLVVILCITNILLWIVFLLKFKSLFSTEDIIEKTRSELNKLVMDINNNTDRNITVYNESSRNLKKIIAEAESKVNLLENRIKLLNDEIQKNNLTNVLQTNISQKKKSSHKIQEVANAYKNNGITSKSSFSLTDAGKEITNNSIQKSLFDDNSSVDTVANVTVNPDGTSYAGIPIVMPTVFATDTPVQLKDDLKTRIVKLYEQGKSIEEIAAELSCSTTEVQFVIDFTDDIL